MKFFGRKQSYLLHLVGDDLYDVLCNPETKSYKDICAIFENHFTPRPMKIAEHYKFRHSIPA